MIRPTALATISLIVVSSLHAQQFSMRLGGLRTQYADTLDASAGSASAQLAWSGTRSSGVLETSWSQFDNGGGAGQMWGSFAAMGPRARNAGLGLRLDGVSNMFTGGAWTATGTSELFGALAAGNWTFTTGLSVGAVRALDTTRFTTAGAALRAWYARGNWTIGGATAAVSSSSARYVDFTATADFHHGRVVAGALAGARNGDLTGPPWYQGRVTVQLSTAIALESSVGSYPKDLAGYDRGRYANLGFRFRLSAPRPLPTPPPPAGSAASPVLIELLDSSTTRISFTIANVTAPAIVGAWNEWVAEPMNRSSDGRWTAILPIGAGIFRFAIVVDDGRWVVPEGVTRLPDDFGGEVGILVVKGR